MRTAILFLIVLLVFSIPTHSQSFDFELKKIIGTPISYPNDVAIDKNNNIYILDNKKINKIDPEGNLLAQIPISSNNYTLEIDQSNNLYVANYGCACVLKYDTTGRVLLKFGSYGSGVGQAKSIHRTSLDSEGNVYYVDYSQPRVLKFNSEGKFIQYIGASVAMGGTLKVAKDVGVDAAGNVYILDSVGGYDGYTVIHKFSPDGQPVGKLTITKQDIGYDPGDMASFVIKKDGGMYLMHEYYKNIIEYDATGKFIRKSAGSGLAIEGGLVGDYINMKLDEAGNLFVADRHHTHSSVKKYSSTGVFIKQYGHDKRFMSPIYDKYGNLYVYDALANTIHVYNPAGDIKLKINSLPFEGKYIDRGYLALDSEGNIYLLHFASAYRIQKFSKNGVLLKNHEFALPKSPFVHDFIIDQRGTMYITDFHNNKIHKLDSDGKYIGIVGQQSTNPAKFFGPQTVRFDAIGFMYVQDWSGNRIQKLSPDENLLLSFGDTSSNTPENFSNFSVDEQGNTYLSYYSNYDTYIRIYDKTGKEVKFIDLWHYGITVTNNGKSYATNLPDGTIGLYTSSDYNPSNYIIGTIFEDKNGNCIKDAEEVPIPGVVVAAEPGPFYALSDKNGNYTIAVDSGAYVINQILPKELGRVIKPLCSTQKAVTLKGKGNNVTGPDFGNKVTLSPYLTTSVSSTRRRRCFESTTKLTYANAGFAPAENAKVYLQLPKEVELLSADKPYTRLPNGTYVFNVGTVAPGQTSVITIQDKVVCGDESIRGLTVCTKAWISTAVESKCPVVTTIAKCNIATGEVRVVIKNTGPEDMEVGELFRIYRNGQLTTVESYKLAAGDSLVLWIPAGGKTIRLEAEQPDCNVSNKLASVTIEGCKVTTDPAPVSTGFVNALPPDEEEPEVAEECLLITDSYDPNDKQVTPTGLTQENYTPTNTALTYKVRFQNTGTDVAYRVVVTDTLSEHLDISTLQLGTASHNYRYEVSGKGRPVLTWTFDNIMLPDSTTNEPGSHGYIQFSIKPKADLPEKTAVENFADIFFDFNSPVRTNTTINRIYDIPEVITETDRLDATKLIATPILEGFSPASGKLGAEVILTGKKFSAVAANNKVLFNGVQATVLAASENELKVQVPANATSGNIKVKTLDGIANSATGFEVYQPPVVSGFMPAEGIAGTTVTLQGNHLTEEWLQSIKLGGVTCEIISISGTSVIVKVPTGANSDAFEVISKGGQTQSVSRFVVWHQPAISNLSTVLDKVGATILITGSNFAPESTRNIVWFGATKAQVLQATTTTLKVKVPEGAISGIITLETPGGTAQSPSIFEVIPAPKVFTFKPAAGSVGSEVELTGAHFLAFGKQDTITFNGQKAIVLEASPDQFKVRVPRGATSGKITVAGIGGQAITASEFKVEELSPEQAIEVYPNPTNGNFTIRFAHADFEIQEIQLFSTLGTLVYSEKVSSPRPEQLDVKLTTPKTGIYILHIQTERGLVIKKLHIL